MEQIDIREVELGQVELYGMLQDGEWMTYGKYWLWFGANIIMGIALELVIGSGGG